MPVCFLIRDRKGVDLHDWKGNCSQDILLEKKVFNKNKKRGNIAPSFFGMSVELFGREWGIEVSCRARHFIVTQSVHSDHLWDRHLTLVTLCNLKIFF